MRNPALSDGTPTRDRWVPWRRAFLLRPASAALSCLIIFVVVSPLTFPGETSAAAASEILSAGRVEIPFASEVNAAGQHYLENGTVALPSRPGVRFARGILVVKLSEELRSVVGEGRSFSTGDSGLDEVLNSRGLMKAERLFPWGCEDRTGGECGFLRLTFPDDTNLETLMGILEETPGVLSVEPAGVHLVQYYPDDALFPLQWALNQPLDHDVNAPEAWDIERGDASIIVAIVDTGVDWQHPDLGGASPYTSGNVWTNWAEAGGSPGVDDDMNGFTDDIRGWDFVTGVTAWSYPGEDGDVADNDPADYFGHGTHLAGIVAALAGDATGVAGLAHGCKVMPVRAGWYYYDGASSGGVVRMDFCAQAIMYAIRRGARIINCSWNSDSSGGLAAAVDSALARGVILSVAAGNEGWTSQSLNYLSTRSECFVVAATDSNDVKGSFSNYGSWVDFSAPGVYVLSTYNNPAVPPHWYAWYNGTSMAAPHVAALSALLLSRESALTRQDVFNRIAFTCDRIDELNPFYAGLLGSGRINAYAALSYGSGDWQERTAGQVTGSPMPVAIGFNRYAAVTSSDGCLHLVNYLGSAAPGWPKCLPGRPTSPAAGNLDSDEGLELVAATDSGYVCVWNADGSVVGGWPVKLAAAVTSGPMLCDLDNDGALEIVCGTADMSLHVLEGDGSVALEGVDFMGHISSEPSFAAVGTDSSLAAILGTSDARLHAIKADATNPAGWPLTLGTGSLRSGSVADIDSDGRGEVFVGDSDGYVYGVDDVGGLLNGWPRFGGAEITRSLALGDMDGDTIPEVVAACTDGYVYAWELNGQPLPGWPVWTSGGVSSSPSLADLTGDGKCEVVVGSDDRNVYIWTASGAPLPGWPRSTGGAVRSSPCLYDFDKDGEYELVVGADDYKLHYWNLTGADVPYPEASWPMYRHDPNRSGNYGLEFVVPGPTPAPGLVIVTSPNPFGGAAESVQLTLSVIGSATASGGKRGVVRIYDVGGRMVAQLPVYGEGSELTVSWDGATASSRKVGSGVYFYKADVDGYSKEGKLVFLKR